MTLAHPLISGLPGLICSIPVDPYITMLLSGILDITFCDPVYRRQLFIHFSSVCAIGLGLHRR